MVSRSVQMTLAIFGVSLSMRQASAQDARPRLDDTYRITQAEKNACGEDAVRLCSSAYPDEEKLLACLKTNKGSLSPSCSAVFAAGLKRRGM